MELRINDIIKEKGLTQKDVAEKLGIAQASLSAMLKGNPTINTLEKIATVLGVSFLELFKEQSNVAGTSPKNAVMICPHCGKPVAKFLCDM